MEDLPSIRFKSSYSTPTDFHPNLCAKLLSKYKIRESRNVSSTTSILDNSNFRAILSCSSLSVTNDSTLCNQLMQHVGSGGSIILTNLCDSQGYNHGFDDLAKIFGIQAAWDRLT